MKPPLYIETSVVSYLTARPSTHIVSAARQHHTRVWWDTRRSRYDLFISSLVIAEAELGTNPLPPLASKHFVVSKS